MKFLNIFSKYFGFEIRRTKKTMEALGLSSVEYERLKPKIRYSPWNSEQDFCTIYEVVKTNTMVDRIRCHEIWNLVAQSAKLEAGSLIEVGVWRGGTGALIASQAARVGLRENVFLCDTFSGVVKAGEHDSIYGGSEHADTSVSAVENLLLEDLELSNFRILEGIFPDETGKEIEEFQFRFCHIDVDVYQSTIDILDWIWPKIVHGGIVVIDDYGLRSCDGITRAVEEEKGKNSCFVFGTISGHAVMVKTH